MDLSAVPEMLCSMRAMPEMARMAAPCCAVVEDVAGVAALADDWLALERRAARDFQVFQSFAWNMAWAETFLKNDARTRPFVIVVRDAAGRARLIWPLMRTPYLGGVQAISWLSDPYCQYGDVLSDLEGAALEEALEQAFGMVREAGADLLRLRHVREDALIAPFLARICQRAPEREGAPWLDLSPFARPEDLDRRYNKNQRRRRKIIARRLSQHFGAAPQLRLVQDGEQVRAALAGLVREKRAWLKRRGYVSRALFHERMEPFLQALFAHAQRHAGLLRPVVSALCCGGRQVSWELGLRFGARHCAYITAQLPEATELSAARLHMDQSQRAAIADGMKVFDLLVPDTERKRTWASDVMPVHEYFLPLSLKGQVFGRGYLCYLRPWLRRAYHKAPMGVRRWLKLLPFGGGREEH